jgi:hypothetical protein
LPDGNRADNSQIVNNVPFLLRGEGKCQGETGLILHFRKVGRVGDLKNMQGESDSARYGLLQYFQNSDILNSDRIWEA